MGFVRSLEGHATISSYTFSLHFWNTLPIETNATRPKIILGDKVGFIAYGELKFTLL